MKTLQQFIIENEIENLNEGLLDKLKNWFKNLFKDQSKLEKNTIKVNVKDIKGPEDSTSLDDILKNEEEMNLINNTNVGFPITSVIIKQKNKYLVYEDEKGNKEEYKPQVDRYFYVEGNAKYEVGIVMYDEDVKNDNNYVNMINLEVIQKVDNISEVQKYINTIFEDKIPTTVINEDKPTRNKEHPTMKPIKLMARLIQNSSRKNEKVLDLFGGSGSTLITCEQLNRTCYMMEYDPKYVDVIIERWENFTGKKAVKISE